MRIISFLASLMTVWLMATAISPAQLADAPDNSNLPNVAEDGRNGEQSPDLRPNAVAGAALGQPPNTGLSSERMRPMSYPRGTYPRRAYPRRPYSSPVGMGRPSGRHVLIGAVIGSLIGVAIGAKTHDGARGMATFGALGGAIGGGMGASTPPFPGRNMYRRGWPDNNEEASRTSSDHSGASPLPKAFQSQGSR